MNQDPSPEQGTQVPADKVAEAERETEARNLSLAAESAMRLGADLQQFMAAAFGAYLAANPALRQQIESEQLLAQLDDLRRRGRLGQA